MFFRVNSNGTFSMLVLKLRNERLTIRITRGTRICTDSIIIELHQEYVALFKNMA